MKTFNFKTLQNQSTKALLLGALTLTPALALTSSAQAAPRNQIESRSQTSAWSNQRSYQGRNGNRRDNDRFGDNRSNNARSNSYNNSSNRDYAGYDYRNNNHRIDYRNGNHGYGNNNGSDTKKLLGAGIIGAIIGAVIAR